MLQIQPRRYQKTKLNETVVDVPNKSVGAKTDEYLTCGSLRERSSKTNTIILHQDLQDLDFLEQKVQCVIGSQSFALFQKSVSL